MDILQYKARLNDAFARMRKAGLIARQSFWCCQSCAGYDLATKVKELPAAKRAQFQGCAFYTKQDAQDMTGRYSRHFKGLHVAYGPVEADGKEYGRPTVAVGGIVKACLEEAGLEVEWNGSPDQRIFVRFPREGA